MTQHFEDFDLAHGGLFDYLIFFWFFELFDSKDLFILIALAFEDHSVCPLPDHPHYIILLHINFYHYNFEPLILIKYIHNFKLNYFYPLIPIHPSHISFYT